MPAQDAYGLLGVEWGQAGPGKEGSLGSTRRKNYGAPPHIILNKKHATLTHKPEVLCSSSNARFLGRFMELTSSSCPTTYQWPFSAAVHLVEKSTLMLSALESSKQRAPMVKRDHFWKQTCECYGRGTFGSGLEEQENFNRLRCGRQFSSFLRVWPKYRGVGGGKTRLKEE